MSHHKFSLALWWDQVDQENSFRRTCSNNKQIVSFYETNEPWCILCYCTGILGLLYIKFFRFYDESETKTLRFGLISGRFESGI